jgi:HipA-like kinase
MSVAPAVPTFRRVAASRYVTPLREGGSLPAIVEADDEGMYVLKFRGAGQGPNALVAELLAGEVGRLIDLPIPEIVFIDLPADLGRTEPDSEIQSLIKGSAGLNIGLDYLPGSSSFDPLIHEPDRRLASAIVWFDAYLCNVDRTPRNVNMLIWHRRLWLIDHGAALYFHHAWSSADRHVLTPFSSIKDHALLKYADGIMEADAMARQKLDAGKLAAIVASIPDAWLPDDPGFADREEQRRAYLDFLIERLQSSQVFVQEAVRARSSHL